MEGEAPPFRMGVFSLQTSLFPPNFPVRQPPLGEFGFLWWVERRLLCREVFGEFGRYEGWGECGYRTWLVWE